MKKELIIPGVAIAVLGVAFVASGSYAAAWPGGYGMMSGSGMMGGYGGGSAQTSTLDAAGADQAMQDSLQNAQIDKANNTITYTGTNIKVVLLGGPEMADDKFVAGGLVNPTIHLPKGANVTLELINEDEGMPHGVEVTPAQPPYPYMLSMMAGVYPGAFVPIIPPAPKGQTAQLSTATATFTANTPGTFYYLCQYPNHAQDGMYGTIVVE